jgi:hypothetical protein
LKISNAAVNQLQSGGLQRHLDNRNRPEQHQRIVPDWQETPPQPRPARFVLQRIDHHRPSTYQPCTHDAAFQGVPEYGGTDVGSGPRKIGRQLPKQQTWNRVRRLSAPHTARHRCRQDRRWCQTVISMTRPASWTTVTAVKLFCWVYRMRVFSHISKAGLPQENAATSWSAVNDSGWDSTAGAASVPGVLPAGVPPG